jgi:hypothetical protein
MHAHAPAVRVAVGQLLIAAHRGARAAVRLCGCVCGAGAAFDGYDIAETRRRVVGGERPEPPLSYGSHPTVTTGACAGGDRGIVHDTSWLRLPYVFICSRSNYLHPHPHPHHPLPPQPGAGAAAARLAGDRRAAKLTPPACLGWWVAAAARGWCSGCLRRAGPRPLPSGRPSWTWCVVRRPKPRKIPAGVVRVWSNSAGVSSLRCHARRTRSARWQRPATARWPAAQAAAAAATAAGTRCPCAPCPCPCRDHSHPIRPTSAWAGRGAVISGLAASAPTECTGRAVWLAQGAGL